MSIFIIGGETSFHEHLSPAHFEQKRQNQPESDSPDPGLSRISRDPSWASAIFFTMARPRPVPSFLVVKNGAKTRSSLIFRNAVTQIPHVNDNPPLLLVTDNHYRFCFRRGLNRVYDKIDEDLLDAHAIQRHRSDPAQELTFNPHPSGFGHQSRQRQGFPE